MKKIKILIPIFNDWESVLKLLENINFCIKGFYEEISVIIINDGSTQEEPKINFTFSNLKAVTIINMKENKGHARSIASGIKYINEKEDFDYIIPMDGDGEDRPEELKLFINKLNEYPDCVITGDRVKRSEGFLFKFCYFVHKYLTFIFTGQSIKFGNYSCLPKIAVVRMVKEVSTWNSFSGSLSKINVDRKFIPSIRGLRYFGPSKMSFYSLVKHSICIMSVFKSIFLFRVFIFLFFYLFFVLNSISIITIIPVILIFLMIILVLIFSRRENLNEFNNSLENINNIYNLK